MSKLIVIATYWNEIEWIDYSLKQIELLNADEVYLADGNFDQKFPNFSTDGTREILIDYCSSNKNATLISPERKGKVQNTTEYLSNQPRNSFPLTRGLKGLKYLLKLNLYRYNQFLMFQRVAQGSKNFCPSNWLWTIDADQFYTDSFIKNFEKIRFEREVSLFGAHERTFPFDKNNYTTSYEKRFWNNMPHRIFMDTTFQPTRTIVRENNFRTLRYPEQDGVIIDGYYNHYKFRVTQERINMGYELGDRKSPDPNRYSNLEPFHGSHPSALKGKFDE